MVAFWLRYTVSVQGMEDLIESDLDEAARFAAGLVPDVVAALDHLVPTLGDSANRSALRRYHTYVESAARTLVALPSVSASTSLSPAVLYSLLQPEFVRLPWVAPSEDGIGVLTVLIDRVRGLVSGTPQQCIRARTGLDEHYLSWFAQAIGDIEFERQSATPLRRAMTTLDLTSGAMAELMGVSRQSVDKWLAGGPPPDRLAKIGAIVKIADILRYRLREGMPPIVARRQAVAYGDRSMLDLIASDEHEWLLADIEDMFDYSTVA